MLIPGVGPMVQAGLGSLGTLAGQGLTKVGLGSVANTLGGIGSQALTGMGTLRGAIGTGATNLMNRIPGVGDNAANKELERIVGGGSWPGGYELPQDIRNLPSETLNKVLPYLNLGGQQAQEQGIMSKLYDTFLGPSTYGEGKNARTINWKTPLAIGSAAGAIQAAMPKSQLPTDTSGIDIANVRSRALTGSDPDLHFLPEGATTKAYAHGGRIGAFNGGIQGLMPRRGRVMYPGGYAGETDYENWLIDNYDLLVTDLSFEDHAKYSKAFRAQRAQGGRIGAQEGGLMDLGGMEKDYRQEGGFVPLGGEEKADDVPARLSKNEFVFTADAVRAAGGGDIDAGAEVMENVMENLEQGGQVSEESQGLEGARDMFATAQRLEGVM